MPKSFFFFFFTLVTGPRRSLSLKLSDTRVYEPQIRRARRANPPLQPIPNPWNQMKGLIYYQHGCHVCTPAEAVSEQDLKRQTRSETLVVAWHVRSLWEWWSPTRAGIDRMGETTRRRRRACGRQRGDDAVYGGDDSETTRRGRQARTSGATSLVRIRAPRQGPP